MRNECDASGSSNRDRMDFEPPWVVTPEIPMGDMYWNMGGGEGISYDFQIRYRALSELSKSVYKSKYPEPEAWLGWYDLVASTG